jgi:hypothetical protein
MTSLYFHSGLRNHNIPTQVVKQLPHSFSGCEPRLDLSGYSSQQLQHVLCTWPVFLVSMLKDRRGSSGSVGLEPMNF